jgi:hypothetical protein
MRMEFSKPFTMMTLLSVFLVFLLASHISNMGAFAQSLDNQSFASSTLCMNDEPCRTLVCSENQPCSTSETPNIENPYEDYPNTREDMMYDFDENYD